MVDVDTLVDGLDGAIGCDYRRDDDRLFFVEYGGKVSRLELTRRLDREVSEGTATIRGNMGVRLRQRHRRW